MPSARSGGIVMLTRLLSHELFKKVLSILDSDSLMTLYYIDLLYNNDNNDIHDSIANPNAHTLISLTLYNFYNVQKLHN